MSRLLIIGPVALGLIFLICSIVPIFQLLKITRRGPVRFGWLTLTALLLVFIPGYAAFAWLQRSAPVEPSDLIVAGLLFFGACFVLSVAILSRQTAEDILRIAALEKNVFTDDLTGLSNRRYLSLRAPSEIARAFRYGVDLSLIMVDIDRFKRVNDRYGHLVGDDVLRAVAETIEQGIRVSDIAVRYGGEELLILATNTNIEGAHCLAERLRAKIAAQTLRTQGGEEVRISASMGVASLREADDVAALLKRADEALYRAKRGGRNRVCREEPATHAPPVQEVGFSRALHLKAAELEGQAR